MLRPTHKLVAKRIGKDKSGMPIGVAWQNEQGWISIKLNPCVVISHNDEVYLSLYPIKPEEQNLSGDVIPF